MISGCVSLPSKNMKTETPLQMGRDMTHQNKHLKWVGQRKNLYFIQKNFYKEKIRELKVS